MPPRSTRPRRWPSTATARPTWPRPAPAAGAVLVHPSTDYVFDGNATRPVRRGRADRARGRLRPHQAGRRAGGPRRPAGRAATSSAPPGCTARTARTSSRPCCGWPGTAPPPAWSPTSTASPPGRPTSPRRSTPWSTRRPRPACTTRPARARRPGSASPRRSSPAAPGSRAHGDRTGASVAPSPHYRRVPDAGQAAGLQRPRPRRLARGRHRAHRRLEGRPAPRLPGGRGGLAVACRTG